MTLGPKDISKLQLSALAMLLMVVLGAGSILVSRGKIAAARAAFAAAQSERNEFEGKLQRVRSEESEIRQKAALFHQLQARGVIGEERRLDWVELLKEIQDTRRLLELRYEIAPQHALDKGQTGSLGLHASTMKLQARLLHEEDLTRLLDDLRQHARALIQVKRCDVSRLPRSGTENALLGLLQAECTIDWVTLGDGDKSKGNAK